MPLLSSFSLDYHNKLFLYEDFYDWPSITVGTIEPLLDQATDE